MPIHIRTLLFVLAPICFALTCISLRAQERPSVDDTIQGTWGIYSAMVDGRLKVAPRAAFQLQFRENEVATITPNGKQNAIAKFSSDSTPRRYDISRGLRTEQAIYEVVGDTLKICLSVTPAKRPADFVTKEGDGYSLFVLRRMKIEDLDRPVSSDDVEDIAKRLQKAWDTNDKATFSNLFESDELLDLAIRDFAVPITKKLSFLNGLKSESRNLSQLGGYFAGLFDKLKYENCKFTVLRTMKRGNDQIIVSRVVEPNGLFTYQELFVSRNCYGYVTIVDLQNLVNQDKRMSAELRQSLFPGLAASHPELLGVATAEEKLLVESYAKVKGIALALKLGDLKSALLEFQLLPSNQQANMSLLLGLFRTLHGKDGYEQELKLVISKIETLIERDKAYPPLLPNYVAERDWTKVSDVLRLLDERVGGDPFLAEFASALGIKSVVP